MGAGASIGELSAQLDSDLISKAATFFKEDPEFADRARHIIEGAQKKILEEAQSGTKAGEIMQPQVLQEMEEVGFPVDIPPDLAPHQKEARQAAQLAMAKALEAGEAERLAHAAAEAARAAAARDPAFIDAMSKQHAQEQQCTSLEEMDRLMEEAPMKLLPFEVLRAFGAIPRSSEKLAHKLLGDISPQAREESFFVFLSHRWFEPSLDPNIANPDKRGLKFATVITAVEKIKDGLKPGTTVYLWIDFFCIDQDDAELKIKGIRCLPAYIYNSDCLLTPYTDKVFDNLAPGVTYKIPPFNMNGLEKVKSLALDLPDGYFGRGWCRLEMYCCTALKVKKGTYCYFLQKGIATRAEQRPHFLVGDAFNGAPQLLPPLANKLLQALNPVEGHLTSASDLVHIQTLLDQNPPPPDAITGYWGERDAAGEPEGHGVEVSEDGGRFEGQFRGGKHHGPGVNTFTNGDVHAGRNVHGEYDGAGVYRFAEGGIYRGQFTSSNMVGHGVYTNILIIGRHAGGFAGLYSGPGVRVKVDGQCEEACWERGQQAGLCTITYPSDSALLVGGGVEVCPWTADKRDGAYVFTRPNGACVKGLRSPANPRGGPFIVYAPDGAMAAEGLDLDAAFARSLEF